MGAVHACGNGVDDDRDGLIDADDPECTGPCDDSEDTFGSLAFGSAVACGLDCFWDNDHASGNDECYWSARCDTHEVSPDYAPMHDLGSTCAYDPNTNIPGTGGTCSELMISQSQACLDFCGPLTPHGCDAFGCCELPAGSGAFVWLGSTEADAFSCDLAHASDPTRCQPCQPTPVTLNPCGHCELCVGKTTLPADCFDGGAASPDARCPDGHQPCGLSGEAACPSGAYCVSGCCEVSP